MALSFKQQIQILSKGIETIVHECDQTKVSHYHFVGAPFRGLLSQDTQKRRESEKIERNLNRSPKHREGKVALKLAFDNEEGWKMVYELAELSIAETYVVEEVIRKQRIFLYNRHHHYDPYDPQPCIARLDEEIVFNEESHRVLHELAKHRNKLMHSLNGNIRQVGDSYVSDGDIKLWTEEDIREMTRRQFALCLGISDETIDYVSLLNELDSFENRRKTCEYEQTTPNSGIVSVKIREERVYATGTGQNKKIIKTEAHKMLLQKLLSTYYFGVLGRLDMKLRKIFPPTMQSGVKENTKRDNKTHKHDNSQRSLKLQNSGHIEAARKHAQYEKFCKLQKIYAIQRKQDKVKTDKLIAQLQTLHHNSDLANLEWQLPVNVKFGDFQEFLDSIENLFNEDVKKIYNWASIANSLYLIYSNPDLMVKWNACDNLRRALDIKTMSCALFASMVIHLFKRLGFIKHSEEHPKVQTFEAGSTVSIIVTLVLTMLYRNTPKASTVEVLVNSFKDLPLCSRGVGLLEDVVKRVCNYVKGVETLDELVPTTLKKIEEKIMELSSKEGLERLTTDETAFVEICKLRLDIISLSEIIDSKSVYYQKFLTLKGHVNNMYNIAQRSPVAGCGRRKKPVVFHIWGDAGIGKSRIIKLVSADTISTILQLEGYTDKDMEEALDSYDQFIYFRPVGVQYEQNFISTRAKIYVCDDANQVDAQHLKQGVPFPQAIIHLNNEHDHMLPVAEIELKSQALFKSALIIATDNKAVPDLSYLQCPEAYHRRIDFSFKMVLKEEYSKIVKQSRVIDVLKLDLTQPNEHIYEFHSGGEVYSYDQVVALLRNELKDVHKRFKDETVVFNRRAKITAEKVVGSEKSREIEEVPAYIADNYQNVERPSTKESGPSFSHRFRSARLPFNWRSNPYSRIRIENEKENRLVSEEDGISKMQMKFSIPGLTRQNLILGREKKARLSEKLQIFLVTYVFFYLPISWADKINNFLFGQTDDQRSTRRAAFTTITFLITTFAAYKLYKRFFKPDRKKEKSSVNTTKIDALEKKKAALEKEIDVEKHKESKQEAPSEDMDTQKYNDGQPKSVKDKGKVPSEQPIKVVPIFKDMRRNENMTKIEVKDYVNSATTEMACIQAYVTEKKILQNMYVMVLSYKRLGVWNYGVLRGVFLNDRCLITNRHFLSITEEEYKTATISLFNAFQEYVNIPTSKVTVVSFAHEDEPNSLYYDLIAIKFGKDIKSHIDLTMQDEIKPNFVKMCDMQKILHQNVTLVSIVEEHEFAKIDGLDKMCKNTDWLLMAEKQRTTINSINETPIPASDPNGQTLWTWKTVTYEAQTIPGSCGSVIVSNSSNEPGRIIGIHMAGYYLTDESFGQIISWEMVSALKPYCQMLYKPGKIVTILPNDFPVIATTPRPLFMPCETKICRSICYNEIFETTKAPAKLKYAKNEEHGAVVAIRKYLNPKLSLNDSDISICKSYLNHCFTPKRVVEKKSREIAIRGEEGNKYIQAINRASSAGYPLAQETKKQGKIEYLGEGEEFIYDHPRLTQIIDTILLDIQNNRRPEIYFSVTMKDELKKIEKRLARIFAAGPLQYTILFREYYIDYFAATMERRVFNTSLIGINMLSSDVDVLVKYLLDVAHPSEKAFLAGDFKNFDGTLMTGLLWEVYEVIELFYNRSDEEKKITEALWLEITDSRQIFGNAVAHISSGQPSGNPATTFINTMYNTSLLYLVISKILREIGTPEALEVFADLTKHFRVVTYGDDNLMSFSHTLRQLIHPPLITKMMKTFGHTYTNDAKDDQELEYKTLSEVSILKRTFSYDSVHGWIAPLELVSILECLNWDKVPPGKFELKRAQTVVNMRVAIRELSLHTQSTFEKYRQLILTSAKRHKLDLPPECMFSQSDLRHMTLCSDSLFYFSDDFSILIDHRLRQGIHLEQDVNMQLIFQDLWPRLEMKQWSAQQQNNENMSAATTAQQILTYDKETAIVHETVPYKTPLPEEKLFQFEEIRDHTIKDILCRVYTIDHITVATGGLPGDIVYTLDPFTTYLNQANVRAKLARFAAFRTNLIVRILITSARTCSGAIMPQYIPQLGTQRATTLLQQSQATRECIPISTGKQVDIEIPWIDAFLARSLAAGTGTLGTYRITRVTPTATDPIKIEVQLLCPKETLRVEYPTFLDQVTTLPLLQLEKQRIEKQIEIMSQPPKINVVHRAPEIPRMQMNTLRHMVQSIASSMPSRQPSTAPITAVKWQPGQGMLNEHAEVPIHSLTLDKYQEVETSTGQFGSSMDEMEVEKIMNSKNIIAVFPLAASDVPRTVLYARPCTITDFVGTTPGTTLSISHQMFVASLAQQWSAKLNFEICGTHNQFHSYQLRSIFVPDDIGKYAAGAVMSLDDFNNIDAIVHKFGADKMKGEHTVEPMLTTNMRNVPSPRNAAGLASLTTLAANRFLRECSYGMFYIVVEVGLIATASVAQTVQMYIDFSASDVILAEPEAYLYLLPQTQMRGIEGESLAQEQSTSKSKTIESGLSGDTVAKSVNAISTVSQSLGEQIMNLRQLTTGSTVFSNSFTATAAQAFLIQPFLVRTTTALGADAPQYMDHIDYICSAYAFRKGGIIISMSKRASDNLPLGEACLVNSKNNFLGVSLSSPRGIQTIVATNSASSGARVQVLYSEECIVHMHVPFMQPFNLNRMVNSDSFDTGNNQKYLCIRPYTGQNCRFFRSAARDFRIGYLTSLPQYTLRILNIFD